MLVCPGVLYCQPIEYDHHRNAVRKLPGLEHECHALGFLLLGIGICGEVEIMGGSILLTGVQHVLQSIEGGGQQPVVITVPQYSVVVAQNPTASSSLFQQSKQVFTIKAICYC